MKKILLNSRYYLEIIALPAFIFLVVHLSGHGLFTLIKDHGHHEIEQLNLCNSIFSLETLGGILLMIIFVGIWNLSFLKKWVPCTHDHCHHPVKTSHLFAILAFCLHFFPESSVRYTLLKDAIMGETTSIVGAIAFLAHFLVDIIVAILLASFWGNKKEFGIYLSLIVICWIIALVTGKYINGNIPESAEAVLSLMSAFLLSMFIHKPHRPKKCTHC